MRTDLPWFEIARSVRKAVAPKPPKPQRDIEEEVAPGSILFGPGRRQSLALLGVLFGLAGAGATTSVRMHPGVATAITGVLTDYTDGGDGICLLLHSPCGGWREVAPPLDAILPPGRRRDPAL